MVYKHHKQSPTDKLNDQIHYKSHTLFDAIKHSSQNISAIPTTMNRNIAASSTGTVKHWKWCTWHQKPSVKNSSKLNKFLHSEVNILIQRIMKSWTANFLFPITEIRCYFTTYLSHIDKRMLFYYTICWKKSS